MLLCLDVGNTHIHGGVFKDEELCLQFRYPSAGPISSDVIGLFMVAVLRENSLDPAEIEAISMSSVLPAMDYSIRSACHKYFNKIPLAIRAGIKTGLNIKVKQPSKVGADRIAAAVAAIDRHPDQHLLVVDFGTATTVCAISAEKHYLGGAIMPGMGTSQQALASAAAQLMPVSLVKPASALGLTTESNIQSGLYYGQLGGVQALLSNYLVTVFNKKKPVVIATGGYAHLFSEEHLYDELEPNLVLHGLRVIWDLNPAVSS